MFRQSSILVTAFVAAMSFAACNHEVEYNSNTGHDGSRDSASQLLVNTDKVDDISAPDGDNEDWFYFIPPEDGVVQVSLFIDKPKEVILNANVMDGFGRPLHNLSTTHGQNVYDLPKLDVKHDRYFISLTTKEGKSSYTIRASFEVPKPPEPEPECSPFMPCADENMTCENGVCVEIEKPVETVAQCVPANKCKKGQNCCKSSGKKTTEETDTTEPVVEEKTVMGTIVLVTPRGDGIADVKINGIGAKNGVQKGAKATLRGLNRKVNLYSCLNTSCQATVKATSDELQKYDHVDVVVP